jgi:hypothetical protein
MIGMQKMVGVSEALVAIAPHAQFAVYDNDYDKIQWFSEDIPQPSRQEVEQKIEELTIDAPLNSLREIRNWLLQESDWTQGQDIRSIRGPEWCAMWDDYRQQLRNITNANFDLSFNEMGVLEGFVLPEKPES